MEKYKDILKEKPDYLTPNQYAGVLLEVATLLALQSIGIQPEPLHNPYDERYADDQHLQVDLIFIHNGKLYGIECKNLSFRSHVDEQFILDEVTTRFDNTALAFEDKIAVFGVLNCKATLPEDFTIFEL